MKRIAGTTAAALILVSLPGLAWADDAPERPRHDRGKSAVIGYVDADGDGANDLFRDANGDGVNDVTGATYPHRFHFVDKDGDGLDDSFVDADGDGVNDLDGTWADADGDGVCDNVIDADGDGRNDITGRTYHKKDLGGRRYGRIDEAAGERAAPFVNEDGDGMHDAWKRGRASGRRRVDVFIDEDGDGIADGRTVRGRMEPMGAGCLLPGGRGRNMPPREEGERGRGSDRTRHPRRDSQKKHGH